MNPEQPLSGKSLRAKAISLLARREYSRQELLSKLSSLADSKDSLDGVLDELTAKGLLSDERAAGSITRLGCSRWGDARLVHALRQKGIDEALIAQAIDQWAGPEDERLFSIWQKKFGQMPADLKEKARQHRFLASRGFSNEAISRLFARVRHSLQTTEHR